MIAYHVVSFSENTPSIANLLLEMQKITGVLLYFEPKQSIIYSKNPDEIVYISESESDYTIAQYSRKINYLTGVTLFTLIKMGGDFDAELPFWVNKPWKKVKILFYFLPREINYSNKENYIV